MLKLEKICKERAKQVLKARQRANVANMKIASLKKRNKQLSVKQEHAEKEL